MPNDVTTDAQRTLRLMDEALRDANERARRIVASLDGADTALVIGSMREAAALMTALGDLSSCVEEIRRTIAGREGERTAGH